MTFPFITTSFLVMFMFGLCFYILFTEKYCDGEIPDLT